MLIVSSTFIWIDQIPLLIVLFMMFASSSVLTHFKKEQKKEFEKVVKKGGPRDYFQAVSNLGAATVTGVLYTITNEPLFLAAFIGSVAAANADSWASEIGGLSKSEPFLITNFRRVKKGISGGVTIQGFAGGLMGALFIVIPSIFLLSKMTDAILIFPRFFVVCSLTGFLGLLIDSYLGAWFQALYLKEGEPTENPENATLIKGYSFINNDVVNLLTTLIAAVLAAWLYTSAL